MGDVQTGKEYIAEVLPQELESRDPGGLALGGGATGASGFESQQGLVTEKAMQPTPVLLPGESQGRRSLVGCSPWGHPESDTTEQLHFSLSCIGEGNGNALQCSCLENPRDGGAWWAAVPGVAQSRTGLTRLRSRSSSQGSITGTPQDWR